MQRRENNADVQGLAFPFAGVNVTGSPALNMAVLVAGVYGKYGKYSNVNYHTLLSSFQVFKVKLMHAEMKRNMP